MSGHLGMKVPRLFSVLLLTDYIVLISFIKLFFCKLFYVSTPST
jgi:hypothetical protein